MNSAMHIAAEYYKRRREIAPAVFFMVMGLSLNCLELFAEIL